MSLAVWFLPLFLATKLFTVSRCTEFENFTILSFYAFKFYFYDKAVLLYTNRYVCGDTFFFLCMSVIDNSPSCLDNIALKMASGKPISLVSFDLMCNE